MVKVDLITGFLGSGKTTFIKKYAQYLIDQGLDKDIVRIEGLDEFITELRRIGNNINQLTHLANSRAIYTVDLSNTKHELNMIWNKLNKLGGNSL